MSKIDCPCKGCTERTIEPNCHMSCERFLEYDKEHQSEKAKIYKIKQQKALLNKSPGLQQAIKKKRNREKS